MTEQNQNRIEEAYQYLREAQSERRTSYAKLAGWSTVPVAALTATVGFANLIGYQLKDHDLRVLATNGVCIGIGAAFALSGMASSYLDKLIHLVDDVRFASISVRKCREYINNLENKLK
jgi:hypothetical protein